jgi:hypothetical protein
MSVIASVPDRAPEFFSLAVDAPTRLVDWRWRLANCAIPTSRRRSDVWVSAARQLRRSLQLSATSNVISDLQLYDRARRFDEMTNHVFRAWLVYGARSQSARAELEARLLTTQPIAEIANRLRMPEDAVTAYEAVFFHVRDRLDSPSWVLHHVFGDEYHSGTSERSYALWWKVYGYFGGPLILDELITKTGVTPGMTPEEAFTADRQLLFHQKAAMAARTLQVNGHTQLPILQHALEIDNYRMMQGKSSPMADGLLEMLQHVRISLASMDASPRSVEPATASRMDLLHGIENAFTRASGDSPAALEAPK